MTRIKIFLLFIPFAVSAQEQEKPKRDYALFQFGMRSTWSMFSDDGSNMGKGVGAQMRIRFAKQINSDWFADYITTDIGGLARRDVGHIGWSVLFYPFEAKTVKGNFTPYVLAGHCFDYTRVQANRSGTALDRWSSAVQAGLGTHYNITNNFDVSLNAQYMLHLGKEIHAEKVTGNDGAESIKVEEIESVGLEGHLLVTLSFNVVIPSLKKSK